MKVGVEMDAAAVACLLILTAAVALQVTEGQLPTVARCYSERDCQGGTVALNSTQGRCCLEPPRARSFRGANGQCHNCDELVVEFGAISYTVNEDAAFINLEILKWGVTDQTILLNVILEDETATGGRDYGLFPEPSVQLSAVILSNETELLFGVQIRDDRVVENNETFTAELQLAQVDSNPSNVEIGLNVTTVVITDNDFVNISIIPENDTSAEVATNNVTLREAAEELTFRVVKEGEADRDVVVVATTSRGSAQDPGDFTAFEETIIFDPMQTEHSVTVSVNDDRVVEDVEYFAVVVAPAPGETGVMVPQNSSIVTITDDNDTVELGFERGSYNTSEAEGSVQLVISKVGENERPVVILFSTANGTATDVQDYQSLEREIAFGAEDVEISLILSITRDGILEDEETFSSVLRVPAQESGVVLDRTTTVITILDSDSVTIGFPVTDPDAEFPDTEITVGEADGEVRARVELLEGTLGRAVVVQVGLIRGSATAGVDFRLASGQMLTFNESTPQHNITIDILDDSTFEARNENFFVDLQTNDSSVRLLPNRAEIEIIEDDSLLISFEEDVRRVIETDDRVQIDVVLNSTLERAVVVELRTRDGSATAGEDFVATSQRLTFTPPPSMVDRHNVSIRLLDDNFSEGLEVFFIQLLPVNFDPQHTMPLAQATVEIMDNENVTLNFDRESYTVNEGDRFVGLVIVKSGVTQQEITVRVVVEDRTAIGGRDYGLFPEMQLNFTSVILPNETAVRFGVFIRDDEIVESTETFAAQLSLPMSTTGILLGNLTEATVFIEDNDVVNVTISPEEITVLEGDTTVTFNVSRDPGVQLDRPVVVRFETRDGTAIAPNDYEPVFQQLVFFNNVSISVTVRISDDSRVEESEVLFPTLSIPPNEPGVNIEQNFSVLTITDNDILQVGFTEEEYDVSEDGGSVTIGVQIISGESERAVAVEVFTVDGTAEASSDYNATVQNITLDAGSSEEVFFSVSILNDTTVEESVEYFFAVLSAAADESGVEISRRGNTTVNIQDDDEVVVEFTTVDHTVGESSRSVTLQIAKSGINSRPVRVDLLTKNGTALAQSDYVSLMRTLEFASSNSLDVDVMTVSIEIADDSVYEADEVFFVVLQATPGESTVSLGTRNATVTIVDDDSVTLGFQPTSYIVRESQQSVEVFIERVNGSNAVGLGITIATQEGSALGGFDYRPLTEAILLGPEFVRVNWTVEIFEDSAREGNETFSVTILQQPERVGIASSATILILDTTPDCRIGFDQEEYSVNEDEGPAIVCVSKSECDETLSVVLETELCTGSGSVILDAVNQTLTLAPVTTGECISIPVNGNNVGLEMGMCRIGLTLQTGNAVVDGDETTVTVRDDEVVMVNFTSSVGEVNETDGTVRVCLSKDKTTAIDFSVTIIPTESSPPEAIAIADFDASQRLVQFRMQDSQACVGIPIITDSIPEGPERFVVEVILPNLQGLREGSPNQTTITIFDGIPPSIGPVVHFQPPTYTVVESDVELSLTVVRERALSQPASVFFRTVEDTAEAPEDFIAREGILNFAPQETMKNINIRIVGDSTSEGNEQFFVVLNVSDNGTTEIGTPNVATVVIVDDALLGNDTIVGDPLFAVPLRSTPDLISQQRPHLCYEIHGRAEWFFNLVSDTCSSVNALYSVANETLDFNVISSIGVKAVNRRGECVCIRISLEDECLPYVTEPGLPEFNTTFYRSGGISIIKLRQHVKISVPNCGNINLVMWITCQEILSYNMIRFVITRGINLQPTSHGLVGQFWNIPIGIEPFTHTGPPDPYFLEEELFVITVNPINSQQRQFVAERYEQTWDTTEGLCFYAGSYQGGPVHEIEEPNDSVIQGSWQNYRVSGLFSSRFVYSQFNESMCML